MPVDLLPIKTAQPREHARNRSSQQNLVDVEFTGAAKPPLAFAGKRRANGATRPAGDLSAILVKRMKQFRERMNQRFVHLADWVNSHLEPPFAGKAKMGQTEAESSRPARETPGSSRIGSRTERKKTFGGRGEPQAHVAKKQQS